MRFSIVLRSTYKLQWKQIRLILMYNAACLSFSKNKWGSFLCYLAILSSTRSISSVSSVSPLSVVSLILSVCLSCQPASQYLCEFYLVNRVNCNLSNDGKTRLPEPLRPHSPLLHPKVKGVMNWLFKFYYIVFWGELMTFAWFLHSKTLKNIALHTPIFCTLSSAASSRSLYRLLYAFESVLWCHTPIFCRPTLYSASSFSFFISYFKWLYICPG